MKHFWLIALLLLTAGCRNDFLKNIEGGAYDRAAKAVSKYCERLEGSELLARERLEARREIRQRGKHGPEPHYFDGLDTQTLTGKGPVVRIYCHGEQVPDAVWEDLIKE